MKEAAFSKKYTVRKLHPEDADRVLDLYESNPMYFEYCPPAATRDTVTEDMTALPPGITPEAKHFVGYYDETRLIAVLDLIEGYPEKETAFIGLFMTDSRIQGRGTGSAIIEELMRILKSEGFHTARLAWVKGNPQAEHFWKKNGFAMIREASSSAAENVILAERNL